MGSRGFCPGYRCFRTSHRRDDRRRRDVPSRTRLRYRIGEKRQTRIRTREHHRLERFQRAYRRRCKRIDSAIRQYPVRNPLSRFPGYADPYAAHWHIRPKPQKAICHRGNRPLRGADLDFDIRRLLRYSPCSRTVTFSPFALCSLRSHRNQRQCPQNRSRPCYSCSCSRT